MDSLHGVFFPDSILSSPSGARDEDLLERYTVLRHRMAQHDRTQIALNSNSGLILLKLRRFGEAYEAFRRAQDAAKALPDAQALLAAVHLNMAVAAEAEHGPEKADAKISFELEQAWALLSGLPKGTVPADLARRCADCFDYFGYFLYAGALRRQNE